MLVVDEPSGTSDSVVAVDDVLSARCVLSTPAVVVAVSSVVVPAACGSSTMAELGSQCMGERTRNVEVEVTRSIVAWRGSEIDWQQSNVCKIRVMVTESLAKGSFSRFLETLIYTFLRPDAQRETAPTSSPST